MRKLILFLITLMLFNLTGEFMVRADDSYSGQLGKYLEDYRSRHRLSPDRRLLLAAADVEYFFTGKKNKNVDAVFSGGQWKIFHAGREIGSVPEYPDFQQFMEVLEQYARQLDSQYQFSRSLNHQYQASNIKKLLDSFMVENVIVALREINDEWERGARAEELYFDACRGLVLLYFQSLDRMQHNDELAARALAMMAVTRAVTGRELKREKALLAMTMRYTARAGQLSADLKEDDPVRLYTELDFQGLKKVSQLRPESAEARFLMLGLAARRRSIDLFQDALKSFSSQEEKESWVTAKYYIDLNAFKINRDLPYTLEKSLTGHIARQIHDLKADSKETNRKQSSLLRQLQIQLLDLAKWTFLYFKRNPIDRFYFQLDKLIRFYDGFYIDSELVHGYYESFFFSCLYANGLFFMDSLGSVSAARSFADHYRGTQKERGRDFVNWYQVLSQSLSATVKVDDLIANLETLSSLGGQAAIRTFEEIDEHVRIKDPKILKAIHLLARRLDSRPAYRLAMADTTYGRLYDLNLTEKLAKSGIAADPTAFGWMVFSAKLDMDADLLLEYSKREDISLYQRGRALEKLEDLTDDPKIVTSALEELAEKYPDNSSLTKLCIKNLRYNKQYERAREIADKWLDKERTIVGLERVVIENEVARIYYDQGLYEECLEYAAGLNSGQAGSMVIKAQLYEKLGQYKNAREKFEEALKRYPYSIWILARYLNFLWNRGQYEDAAHLIQKRKYPLSSSDWSYEIFRQFWKAFKGQDPEKAVKAFKALAKGGPAMDLLHIPGQINRFHNPELAFRLSSILSSKNGFYQVIIQVSSYRYLKEFKGKKEAMAWLGRNIPRSMLNKCSRVFYSRDQYELLWELIVSPEKGEHPEYVWLMRAAAFVNGYNDPALEGRLKIYYLKNKEGRYQKIGRFLMGLETVDALIPFLGKEDALCEIAYFIGLKEEKTGRLDLASDWYHVAMSTGLTREGEYVWSIDQLYLWYVEGVYLDKLAKKKASRALVVEKDD